MQILILTPQLPIPPQALTGLSQGTTIRNFNLIAGLARRHTVDLLTFLPPDLDPGHGSTSASAATELLRPYCRQVIAEPAPVRTLARRARDTLFSPLPDMALRLDSPLLHRRMAALLRENRYDIVQVEGIEMAPYVLAADGRPGGLARAAAAAPRLVFDDHNAEYLLQKRNFLTDARQPRRWIAAAYSFVQWQKLVAYERRICRAADRVIAVSEADREALRAILPDLEVAVIPNGVDLAFYRRDAVAPLAGIGPHALVFTGKMDYRPNVDAVLWFADAVLPLILAQMPDAHFYVVGQQPHERLARLARHPAITLTGRVPDTRPYIAAASVYVVPLRIGGGTRLKVLEAMAMGQAIVSTRLGCDGFDFGDGREVMFADEPAAFATAVINLCRDRAQAAELGRRARAYVEMHYGWDAIVPRLEALYA
jgi:sugar transferase (PEP-CTERM/EpsH1 system associated)